MTRCGIVTLAGAPNVGKSTLLNRIVGEHLAITSAKAQSTRTAVVGLVSDERTQLIFYDTPGLLDPKDSLHVAMRAAAHRALRDADVVVHVVDATTFDPASGDLWSLARWTGLRPGAPVLTVLNKCDLLDGATRPGQAATAGAVSVSARTGEGMDTLMRRLRDLVPEGPFLYPAEDASTQHLRFFVAELVREATLEQLDDEVPHAVACAVEEFRESRTPVYIRAVLYVERESQKRIVVGASGARIREIGRQARPRIEALVGRQVYLDLWVKVLHNWRRDVHALRRLGYDANEDSTR